ncbi:hypothetical protein KI809_10560 [Geobacter pelophilus]|uniref:Uncharacterized protein n=1 Tax=Geoanaerobacter pelophilus TaxID=60036 RepID=A0AAW4L1A3_9BACT|nr:hypothetical protein [Geoanaerobacter pelophilus]MBT0664741.1 hypothetical protein [Geoanaerobacter pelophilus]
MTPEFRCSRCETLLDVTPDNMHTDGFTVEPCPRCITCDGCIYQEED